MRPLREVGEYSPPAGMMVFSTASLSEGESVEAPPAGIYTVSVPQGGLAKISDYYPCSNPSWSPNGRYVVFDCLGKLFYLDRGDDNHQRRLADGSDYYRAEWSPMGDKIAVKIRGQKGWRFQDLEFGRAEYNIRVATTIKKAGWGEIKRKMKGGIE